MQLREENLYEWNVFSDDRSEISEENVWLEWYQIRKSDQLTWETYHSIGKYD